jgi:tetratricopeptide (TPR) repeat protein
MYLKGFMLRGMGKFKQALESLDEAIRIDPENANYHSEAAMNYLASGKGKEALKSSEIALGLDPDEAGIWSNHAKVLYYTDKSNEALVAIDKALELDPEDADVHMTKGMILADQKDFAKSIEYYREALRIDPQSDWARKGYLDALRARNPAYKVLVDVMNAKVPVFYFGHVFVLLALVVMSVMIGTIGQIVKFMAPHLLNVMLSFDPQGKHALDDQEIRRARILAVYVVSSWALSLALFVTNGWTVWFVPFFCLLYMAPLVVTRIFEFPEGDYRKQAMIYCGVALAFGLTATITSFFAEDPFNSYTLTWEMTDTSYACLFVFLGMAFFSRRLNDKHELFV